MASPSINFQLPSSSDALFVQKLYSTHMTTPSFSKPRMSVSTFTVSHYAGHVTYHKTGCVSKNMDFISLEHISLIRGSKVCEGVYSVKVCVVCEV